MLRLYFFGFVFFWTCIPPVANFWFFLCRHGNGNGDVGDTCWAFCQCRAPNTCEAGIQRCVAPGRLNDHCHLTKPCGKGLSCHPGVQKCYHVPRRLHEPCVAGFECGSGLSCQPGIQVCFHALRRYNEPCVSGHPCGPGLSCQVGSQRCLHFPRLENERCSFGFECGVGLECTLCAEPYLTCQLSRVPYMNEEFYQRPYNKVAFLVTHNAFSNSFEYAVWVRNQRVSVAQQLRDGVRGLMLDIYPGWGKAEVRLCHANCFWYGSANLLDTLIQIRNFLDTNPREVVTIIFEDYLKNPTILKHVFDQARVSSHVLSSDHWGSRYKDWPTLAQMRALGRLVVLNNNGLEGFPYTVYNMWYYVRENRYGQQGLDTKTCVDRAESKYNTYYNNDWSLVLVNWFGTATNPLNPCLNSYPKLKEKLNTCQRVFGQRANFIAVDFYHASDKGGAFKAVQWLNHQWKEQFPTVNKTIDGNSTNKKIEKTEIYFRDQSNQNITEIIRMVSKMKNTSTSHVTNTDHVMSTLRHMINTTTHVVSNTSEENHVVNLTSHMDNSTSHVISMNTSEDNTSAESRFPTIPVAKDTPSKETNDSKTIVGVINTAYSANNKSTISLDSGLTSWENETMMDGKINHVEASNFDSNLLRYNANTSRTKNIMKNNLLPSLVQFYSGTRRQNFGKDLGEGINVNEVFNTTEVNDKDKTGNWNETEGIQLSLTNNTNTLNRGKFLKEQNFLHLKSNNVFLHEGGIYLNTTESNDDSMYLVNNGTKAYQYKMKSNKSAEINNTLENGINEESIKRLWNVSRNGGNRTKLLEEIINDM